MLTPEKEQKMREIMRSEHDEDVFFQELEKNGITHEEMAEFMTEFSEDEDALFQEQEIKWIKKEIDIMDEEM